MDNVSYVHGSELANTQYVTIPALLDTRAIEKPEQPCYIFRTPVECDKNEVQIDRTVITFGDVSENSINVATCLLNLGIKKGDRLAILGTNCPEYLYTDYACLRIGVLLIRLPANILHPKAFQDVLEKYHVKGLILDPNLITRELDKVIPALRSGNVESINSLGLKHLFYLKKQNVPVDSRTVTDMVVFSGDRNRVLAIQHTLDPDDIAVILPTSGTTGLPKFVAHSHFSIVHSEVGLFPTDDTTVLFNERSFSWVGGLPYYSVILGVRSVLAPPDMIRRDDRTRLMFRIWEEEKVTNGGGLPFLLHDMMEAIKSGELRLPPSLRILGTGSDLIPKDLVLFFKTFSKYLFVAYGSTECGMSMSSLLTPHASDEDAGNMDQLHPQPGYEVKVVDENNQIVSRGQIGSLYVRSLFTMDCILDDPSMTDQIRTKSGWIQTGDLAIINKQGTIQIVGRTKDVISRGGVKVYPRTVEDVISKHTKVEKVVVVGVPDPIFWNEICACIIPAQNEELTEQELRLFCEQQAIGSDSMLLPQYYIFMKDFPKGPTGKFDRKSLSLTATDYFKLK